MFKWYLQSIIGYSFHTTTKIQNFKLPTKPCQVRKSGVAERSAAAEVELSEVSATAS